MKIGIKRVLLWGIVLPLALTSCKKQQVTETVSNKNHSGTVVKTHADSLMSAALTDEDDKRISVLTDSLSALGELSPIKTNFYKGYVYRLQRRAVQGLPELNVLFSLL